MQVAKVHGAQCCSDLAVICAEYTAAKYASLQYTTSFFYDILIAGYPAFYDM
jgi:hypothetical protein